MEPIDQAFCFFFSMCLSQNPSLRFAILVKFFVLLSSFCMNLLIISASFDGGSRL